MTLENINKTATVSNGFEVIITPFDTFHPILCYDFVENTKYSGMNVRKEIGPIFETLRKIPFIE